MNTLTHSFYLLIIFENDNINRDYTKFTVIIINFFYRSRRLFVALTSRLRSAERSGWQRDVRLEARPEDQSQSWERRTLDAIPQNWNWNDHHKNGKVRNRFRYSLFTCRSLFETVVLNRDGLKSYRGAANFWTWRLYTLPGLLLNCFIGNEGCRESKFVETHKTVYSVCGSLKYFVATGLIKISLYVLVA